MHYKELARMLDYDPLEGSLTWNTNPSPYHDFIGKDAGVKNGKYQIKYKGKRHQASILVWLIMTGELPSKRVEHIDNNPFNLIWSNLSLSTPKYYSRKQCIKRNNKSGHKGVSWSKQKQKWQANIKVDGKFYYLGRYDNIEDAVAARKRGEDKYWK